MLELKEISKAIGAKLIRKANQDLVKGVSTDSRTIKKGEIFFALKGDNFDGHNFINNAIKKGAHAVVVSEDSVFDKPSKDSAKINILKVKDTTVALGQLAKYYRKRHAMPLITITGSAGKTTTKDIIAEVLSTQNEVLKNFGTFNNHIGIPQTIFKLNRNHKICVLELGTNHFGEISYLGKITYPQIAVITNIGASHLEFFKGVIGVFKEKISIIHHLTSPRIILLNRDDLLLNNIKLDNKIKIFYFGVNKTSDFMASNIFIKDNKLSFTFNKKHQFYLNTLGKFNVYNALAGIGCGLIFGISIKKIKEALFNFRFPLQRLNRINCSRFILLDDTYNSNPLSLKEAIESLVAFKTKGRKILVMGDMLELGDDSVDFHRQIGDFIAKKPIDMLITLGKLSKFTAETLKFEDKDNRQIISFYSKHELTDFLKRNTKAGDILLIKGSRLLKMEEITTSLQKYAL